jgi:hypothetical protein
MKKKIALATFVVSAYVLVAALCKAAKEADEAMKRGWRE